MGLGATGCPGGLPAASGPTGIIARPRVLETTGGVGPVHLDKPNMPAGTSSGDSAFASLPPAL
eukprot:14212561-Alexandrium_andersonii.AAC.1